MVAMKGMGADNFFRRLAAASLHSIPLSLYIHPFRKGNTMGSAPRSLEPDRPKLDQPTLARSSYRSHIARIWPRQLLGPLPDLKIINIACWGLLASCLAVSLSVPLWVQLRTGADMLHLLPADFIYFYGIGQIAHHDGLASVYDFALQTKVFNGIYLLHDTAYGPSPYPPYVALFFSLFARLPFSWAFALWAILTLCMYVAGIRAILKSAAAFKPLERSLIVCFALAFYPFLIATLANGQLAAIAVCAVSLAFAFEKSNKPFASGLALSLVAYKPTLLLLLVPMLLLTRRFKTFAAFVAGVALLALVATAFGGISVWPAYLNFLKLFGRVAGFSDRSGLPLSKFIDLGSCLQLALGGKSSIASAALIAITCIVVIALAVLWWKSSSAGPAARSLAWATALTFTLLINVYVPIYDSVLAVVAVTITLSALRQQPSGAGAEATVFLSTLTLAASWFTIDIAAQFHVQILSIAIAAVGGTQLFLLAQSIRAKSLQPLPAAAKLSQA